MMRSRPLPALAALFAGLLLAACASGPERSSDEPFVGPPTEVRWLLYRTGQTITLVNDAHTDRIELYSQVREAAGPKVARDIEMDALVEFLDEQDFDDYAQDGPAPTAAGEGWSQALELTVDGDARHMLLGAASPPEQRLAFNRCAEALMTLWNLTFQSQAVENEEGREIFYQPGTKVREKSR